MRFEVDLEMQVHIDFDDISKSDSFFIEGDWKESFWKVDELRDLAEIIAYAFSTDSPHYMSKYGKFGVFLEGFGDFFREDYSRPEKYRLDDESAELCGGITITVSYELEVVSVSHVD